MNNITSLTTLKQQSAYILDVHVRQGEKITGGFGKTFYKAQWINQKNSPIVLLEMRGNKANIEAILYITLHHPHIIKTYGLVEPNGHRIHSDSILLLQEYAENGDLGTLLNTKYFIPSQYVLLEIFIQISSAMIYFSQYGIIHGDLACRNALVFQSHPHEPKKNLVKLIDFGLTRDDSKTLDVKIDIPIRYVATEILHSQGQSNYSEKSEVYSFGVLMWEACSYGQIPYDDIDDDKQVEKEKLQGKKLTQPTKCDQNIWKLMNICWNDRPSDRPNFEIIHKQLQNIQNIQSSSVLSDSMLSSSRRSEDNSCLFEIECEICDDCGFLYTDKDSHLNKCNGQKLTCFQCGKQYQRAIYDDHVKTCGILPDAMINTKATLDRNSLELSPTATQLPCEICNRLIDKSQFKIHQRQCDENDRRRIENKRREIERSKSNVEAECTFCNRMYSINEVDNHQKNCSSNPINVPDTLSIQTEERSSSIPTTERNPTNEIKWERVGEKYLFKTLNYSGLIFF
ncbi:unnamed protein product [Rotaria sp. Silwood1]|nr:unnamed protein product [Rotaria sp. Silwood1]